VDDKRISIRERVRTIDYIEWLARETNAAAAWLADHHLETEGTRTSLPPSTCWLWWRC
jgi:hypothetical protein